MWIVFLLPTIYCILYMCTATYYKIGTAWFLNCPNYIKEGGDKEDLERIGGFGELLEFAAQGNTVVNFCFDLQKFEGADMAELEGSSGGKTDGYYYIKSFEGRSVDLEIWINKMIYLKRQELPQKIYLKKV